MKYLSAILPIAGLGFLLGAHYAKGAMYSKIDVGLAYGAGITEGAKTVALKCDTKAYLSGGRTK